MTEQASQRDRPIGRRRARAEGGLEPHLPNLWKVVFRARAMALAVLAAGAAVVPGYEGERLRIVGVLVFIVLPYNWFCERWAVRRGRPPLAMPYLDETLTPLIPLLAPASWAAAMFVMVANMALIPIAFGRRVALQCTALGAASLVIVSLVIHPARTEASVLLYLVTSLAIVAIVGTLADGERRLQDRYGDLVEGVDAIVWEGPVDTLTFTYVSPAAERILGYPVEQWLHPDFWWDHTHPDDREQAAAECMASALRGEDYELEYRMTAADGRHVHLRDVIRVELDEQGSPLQLRGVAIDVTAQRETESRLQEGLRHQALHDALTGLPNRALLTDRLHQAVHEARRTETPVALLVMDLDQFKEVNDALGHHHGDLLLVEIARRLQRLLRDCDTIARLGGDEFAMLLTVDAGRDGAVAVAEKIGGALEQPFSIDELSLQTNASIGIALYPEHAVDAEELVRRADVAMYTAKRSTASHAVYAAEHDRSSVRRLTLLGELRRAIDLDELVVYFQPTIDLRSGAAVRAEALVRWQHPEHGLMAPGEFIELAEVSGMIQPLTRWVCERAILETREWTDAGVDLGVSINLSVRNLYDPDLVPWLQATIDRSGLPAHLLTLEITESEVMEDPLVALDVLGRLRAMGVATSIDDFGTGHSSLAYLKHLPIDEIKIDRSFVGGMGDDASDATIVRSIIDLGRNLGLGVVAEGVEDAETLHRLADLGCDRAQGYHIGRPMPAASLRTHLARRPGPRSPWVPPTHVTESPDATSRRP